MDIYLKKVSIEYAEDIETFREEILVVNDKDSFAGCFGLRECESVEKWISDVYMWVSEETCPDDMVPSDYYIAIRRNDNRIVGIIDLRHRINTPVLSEWGGHMGYSVRPCERRKGYAKEMLRLNLINARKIGIDNVMVTCNYDNYASERAILANGGVLEKEINVDGDIIKRYWINLECK